MVQNFKDAKILGQLSNASNATLLMDFHGQKFVYKPMSGERELWDFPTGTLYQRERAAYVLAKLLNWQVVPETTIVEGPFGIGSWQEWKDGEVLKVDVFTPTQVPVEWVQITSGVDENGNEVVLAHEFDEDLQRIALFDAVLNNADRKAGHIITDSQNFTWAIDHGVTFNVEPKLRTVLWGWLDQEIPTDLVVTLNQSIPLIENSELVELLSVEEVEQLISRMENLTQTKKFPVPSRTWPAVPWPVF